MGTHFLLADAILKAPGRHLVQRHAMTSINFVRLQPGFSDSGPSKDLPAGSSSRSVFTFEAPEAFDLTARKHVLENTLNG